MMPGPGGAAVTFERERGRALARSEHSMAVQRLRRVMRIGLCVWLASVPFDLGVALLTGEGHLWVFLGARALGVVFLLFVIARLSRLPEPSPRALIAIDLFIFTAASVLISLMSLTYRGLASPYAPAIMVVVLSRSVLSPAPWWRGAWLFGAPALAYPVTVVAVACFNAHIAREFGDARVLAPFLAILYLLLQSSGILTLASHLAWHARREALELRNIGRYKLERQLGAGGMGEVWAAFDLTLQRRVALKMIGGHSPGSPRIARLEREVQALAELTHPNTVRVSDYGVTEDGLWYYAMELLHGETLRSAVLRSGPLAPERVLRIARQVLSALAEAHERGIIHRDIKPENVFLIGRNAEADVVKLLDFGIAKAPANDVTLTNPGYVAGTPAYMAPELILGAPASVRSDLYAFGATLYYVLTARLPFREADVGALLAAHLQRDPEPFADITPAPIPVELERVVLRCMAKRPDDRYESIRELLEALPP